MIDGETGCTSISIVHYVSKCFAKHSESTQLCQCAVSATVRLDDLERHVASNSVAQIRQHRRIARNEFQWGLEILF